MSKLIRPDDVSNKPYLFISYSRQDMETAQRIIGLLKAHRFRLWYDMGLKSGSEWAEELGNRICKCEQFIVLITENSVKSKYVRKEIGLATEKNKNILVIYLEEVDLTSGLQLLLGDIQAVHRQFFHDEADFYSAICESITSEVKYQERTPEGDGQNRENEDQTLSSDDYTNKVENKEATKKTPSRSLMITAAIATIFLCIGILCFTLVFGKKKEKNDCDQAQRIGWIVDHTGNMTKEEIETINQKINTLYEETKCVLALEIVDLDWGNEAYSATWIMNGHDAMTEYYSNEIIWGEGFPENEDVIYVLMNQHAGQEGQLYYKTGRANKLIGELEIDSFFMAVNSMGGIFDAVSNALLNNSIDDYISIRDDGMLDIDVLIFGKSETQIQEEFGRTVQTQDFTYLTRSGSLKVWWPLPGMGLYFKDHQLVAIGYDGTGIHADYDVYCAMEDHFGLTKLGEAQFKSILEQGRSIVSTVHYSGIDLVINCNRWDEKKRTKDGYMQQFWGVKGINWVFDY